MISITSIVSVSRNDKHFNDFENHLTKEDGWSKIEDTLTVTWKRSRLFEIDIDKEEEKNEAD